MRVLLATHIYPPKHSAGVEVFASTTARLIAEAGHEVVVVTTDKDIARADLSVRRREHEGVPVLELTNNLFARRFEETWRRPEIDAILGAFIDELEPDVVHVHHLLYLSAGLLDVCAERGVPVVMTMHDFWLGCARFGQLLHADGTRCDDVEPARCGTCLPSFKWRQSDAERRLARGVSALARTTGLDVSGPLKRVRAKGDAVAPGWSEPDARARSEYERLAASRRDDLVATVNGAVARVLLPAAFMRGWYERLGLRPELLHVETTGVDWEGARSHARVERGAEEPVRFLFLGSQVPHKGAHLLLDAWEQLSGEVRGQARLRILGPDGHRPDYVAGLRARAAALGIDVGGKQTRDEVRREMARTDVLVTPSQWAEIRPLVMLEAYAAGARCIATDLGGMGEVIRDGLAGTLFPEGDVGALRGRIEHEIARASRGNQPSPRPGPSPLFRGWPEVAAALVGHYRAAAGGDGATIG